MVSIVAILNVWKRHTLEEQIKAVQANSVAPDRIIVYQNESHVDISDIIARYKVEHLWSLNFNRKYHARFKIPPFVNADYYAIFDDDTVPGPEWHRHAIETLEDKNCIVGINGRAFIPELKKQFPAGGVANNQFFKAPTMTDYCGHGWLLKKQHIMNMWSRTPATFETGEDTHISIVNRHYYGIPTFVPPQEKHLPNTWGTTKPQLGYGDVASLNARAHNVNREQLLQYWLDKGWKPFYEPFKSEDNRTHLRPRSVPKSAS